MKNNAEICREMQSLSVEIEKKCVQVRLRGDQATMIVQADSIVPGDGFVWLMNGDDLVAGFSASEIVAMYFT